MGKGSGAHYRDLMALIESELAAELQSQAPLPLPGGGRVSRRVRHFPIPPVVDVRPDERGSYHSLNIVASDRPGLLYRVARRLSSYQLDLHSAKINTLGDRAEDVFLVSGATLADSKAVLKLEQELLEELQI
jgi:[protein-PII] uridylyltransferase